MNLLLLCISSPVYYALYDECDHLLDSGRIDEKPSTALPKIYALVRENLGGASHDSSATSTKTPAKPSTKPLAKTPANKLSGIYYASGPGNLSALKLTHTFLHSWAILESIPLYATHSFTLLPDQYIYAFGKKYFTMRENAALDQAKSKEQNLALTTAHIQCVLCETPPHNPPFTPPKVLAKSSFCLPCEPIYILPPL